MFAHFGRLRFGLGPGRIEMPTRSVNIDRKTYLYTYICAEYDGDDYEETLCLLICDRYITRITNSASHDFNALEIRLIIGIIIIIMYIGILFSYIILLVYGKVGMVCALCSISIPRIWLRVQGPKAIVLALRAQYNNNNLLWCR